MLHCLINSERDDALILAKEIASMLSASEEWVGDQSTDRALGAVCGIFLFSPTLRGESAHPDYPSGPLFLRQIILQH